MTSLGVSYGIAFSLYRANKWNEAAVAFETLFKTHPGLLGSDNTTTTTTSATTPPPPPPLADSDSWLGPIVALQCAGMAHLRKKQTQAEGEGAQLCVQRLSAYLSLAEAAAAGGNPCHFNMPDAWLAQRGYSKMSDIARAIARCRYRAYSPEMLFEAHISLAVAMQANDSLAAVEHCKKALIVEGVKPEARSHAHQCLAQLYNILATATDTTSEDAESDREKYLALSEEHAQGQITETEIATKQEAADSAKNKTVDMA